jgi:hypothetical protein
MFLEERRRSAVQVSADFLVILRLVYDFQKARKSPLDAIDRSG